MTALEDRAGDVAAEQAAQSKRLLVALNAADVQFGVLVDANAVVSRQVPALLDLVNGRLGEIGEPALVAEGRGRWALCWVDGSPLRAQRSLTEQGVRDGAQLWLRFLPDTEARAQVIEHVTTAMAAELKKRWAPIEPLWAARVGTVMLVVALFVDAALLLWWRHAHPGWLAAGCAAAAALVLWGAVAVVARKRGLIAAAITTGLLVAAAVSTAVAAATSVPGPLGAPQAAVGAATLAVVAFLVLRFTGRYLTVCTTAVVLGVVVVVAGITRMVWMTSAVTVLAVTLLVAVLGMHMSPGLARRLSAIPLPVYPSAAGKWIFDQRPDLPSTVVVAAGADPTLEGPDSVRSVVRDTERARGFHTGLLIGFCTLIVVSLLGLCDPTAPRRWLPLVLAGVVAVAVLLRGRSYTDRWQATIFAVTTVTMVVAIAARYALTLWSPMAVLIAAVLIVAIPAAGLGAAVVVPSRIYTPSFRSWVEWIEYLCLVAVFPLTFWVMDVFAAIRYR